MFSCNPLCLVLTSVYFLHSCSRFFVVDAFVMAPTKNKMKGLTHDLRWRPYQGLNNMASNSDTTPLPSSTKTKAAPTTLSTSLVSPKFQVYIEDTDAYGVMYNSNYLRSYDRALHTMYAVRDHVSTSAANGDGKSSILAAHEDWAIVHVENQKFKSSPKLGGMYCVHGTLVEQKNENQEVWDVTMQETEAKDSTVFNSATVTVARPGVFVTPQKILLDQDDVPKTMTTHKDIFRLFRDEFDTHFPNHIPLRNVLNLFERSRSNFLGGPECLRKLQEDHGLLFVVTKIDDCCEFPLNFDGDESDFLRPGQMVLVQTDFEVKRKGMIIECHHTMKTGNRPVAQATVTLMTLDANTFKPSTNLPNWLWDILQEA